MQRFIFSKICDGEIDLFIFNIQDFLELSRLETILFHLFLVSLPLFLGTFIFVETSLIWGSRDRGFWKTHAISCYCDPHTMLSN